MTFRIEIEVEHYFNDATDRERLSLIKRLLETIKEEGTIDRVRDLVAKEDWND